MHREPATRQHWLRQSLHWAQWWPSVRAGLWVVLLFAGGLALTTAFADTLRRELAEHLLLGAAIMVATSAIAVLLPAASNLPLVPLATLVCGPWLTAAFLLLGWTLGSALAFRIGRRGRGALLARFPALRRHADIERLVHPRHRLASLVLLRMTFPVDVLSYALGLFSPATTLWQNTAATVLGAAPFALLFAHVPALPAAGQALVFGGSVAVFLSYAAWVLRRGTSAP